MIRHFREIIFNCYYAAGLKLQNMIHCIAVTLRVAKSLAKEILYEMYTANLLQINLIELRDFGCDGCTTDITKFSKKSCNPRECLILVHVKESALIDAIRSELKECIATRLENYADCFEIILRRVNQHEVSPKIIADALTTINYEHLVEKATELRYAHITAKDAAIETIATLLEKAKEKQEAAEISTILEKINALHTDSNTEIYRTLTAKEYAKFAALKQTGKIYYDTTTKTWKQT